MYCSLERLLDRLVPAKSHTKPVAVHTERFEAYAARFDDLFARADQRSHFRLYLRGLLSNSERKNVEAMAGALGASQKSGANLAQALQHFVTESPWDQSRVLGRYRELLAPRFSKAATTWVIYDEVLLKKGRKSVGTQRQYARALKRKVNCQLAVVVGSVLGSAYVPLAIRLYLPGVWLRESAALAKRTVPADYREYHSKSDLALNLVDEIRTQAGDWPLVCAALDAGYSDSDALADALADRNIHRAEPRSEKTALAAAAGGLGWLKSRLGLDHFEGRSWLGWHHHAALVFVAAGFLLLHTRGRRGSS